MTLIRALSAALAMLVLGSSLFAADPRYRPARYESGGLPALSPSPLAGGEVILEVTVTSQGSVGSIKVLRTTPAYTDGLTAAVKTWRFVPADEVDDRAQPANSKQPARKPVDSTVLVAGVFRPPALLSPTLGDVPRDVASEADGTPFPVAVVQPPFPATALMGGIVLIETTIDSGGRATESHVLQSSPPFDQPALEALSRWRFRPARVHGSFSASLAYVIFTFPQPVVGASPSGGR